MKDIFEIVKDGAILIMIVTTLDRIRKGGDERWHRVLFIMILFLL
jgi:hypothetical protein